MTPSTQLPGTDFLALLNQSQARTAPAEGHKSQIEKDRTPRDTRRDDLVHSERPQRRDAERTSRRELDREPVSGHEPQPEAAPLEQPAAQATVADTNQTPEQNAASGEGSATPQGQQPPAQQPPAPAATGEAAVAAPAQVTAIPLVQGAGAVADPASAAATPAATAAVTGAAAAAATPVDPAALAAAAAATAGTPATGDAAATVTAGAPTAAAGVPVDAAAAKALDAAANAATPAPVTDATASTVTATDTAQAKPADAQATAPTTDPQQPQATPAGDRTQAGGQQGQFQGDTPKQFQPQSQQQPQAAAAAAAAVQADPATSQSASSSDGQPGTANPLQPFGGTSAPAAAVKAPVSRATPVHISNAAEAVENTIRIASQRGITHAKLALKPAELGGVEIRLLQSAAGLSATVVADSPEAAKLLQQAGQDLRDQLEAQGVQLQNLDISYSGDEPKDAAQAFAQLNQGGRRPADGRDAAGAGASADSDPIESTQPSTLELPDGVLVDVLA